MHSQYQGEIYHALGEKELRSRVPFYYRSPQLECRQQYIVILNALAERLSLSETATHLAALLLDRFMDNHDVSLNRVDLLVAVCVLIASKVELTDAKVPFVSQLGGLLRHRHSPTDFVQLERMLVQFFDWTLMLPTAAHFTELLMPAAVAAADVGSRHKDTRRLRLLQTECRELVLRYLGATLFEVHSHDFLPSLVASSCLLAARSSLRLRDAWPRRLARMTGYAVDEVRRCVDTVLPRPRKRRHAWSPDGGYESGVDLEGSPDGKRVHREESPVA